MLSTKDYLDFIKSRHCKRAFFDTPVPKHILTTILNTASNAASSKNSQPWNVSIVTGKSTKKLSAILCEKFDNEEKEDPDYSYMTSPMPDLFKQRARECGYSLFDCIGIEKTNYEQRKHHNRRNVEFFGAPCVLFLDLHHNAMPGNFLDTGAFLQNIMLGLVANNLGSCPQYSLTSYSKTIKSFCKIPKENILVCGLSIGSPDPKNPINSFIPKRVDIETYTRWVQND